MTENLDDKLWDVFSAIEDITNSLGVPKELFVSDPHYFGSLDRHMKFAESLPYKTVRMQTTPKKRRVWRNISDSWEVSNAAQD